MSEIAQWFIFYCLFIASHSENCKDKVVIIITIIAAQTGLLLDNLNGSPREIVKTTIFNFSGGTFSENGANIIASFLFSIVMLCRPI